MRAPNNNNGKEVLVVVLAIISNLGLRPRLVKARQHLVVATNWSNAHFFFTQEFPHSFGVVWALPLLLAKGVTLLACLLLTRFLFGVRVT